MKKLTTAQRVQIVKALVEGMGINPVCRMTGIAKNTVLKLLADLGQACDDFQDKKLRGLKCHRVQCDEIWAFCHSKAKNVKPELEGVLGYGDLWTWTAIDAETKLMICWLVGPRDAGAAWEFMHDLAGRVTSKMQLTTDGLGVYMDAVADNFGSLVDYGQLVKLYGNDPRAKGGEAHYSPAKCVGAKPYARIGCPDHRHISTSFVERANLTIRMHNRRFTRLTNAHSKKLENHEYAVALQFAYYNFCKVHMTLRVTPAMEAGLADHVWEVEELVGLLETKEREAIAAGAMKRGPYQVKDSD